MTLNDLFQVPSYWGKLPESKSSGAYKHCFQYLIGYTIPGIPYDWSILTVRRSFAFLRADSNKHVEHVKPSYTAPFDVLTFEILSRETVFQNWTYLSIGKGGYRLAPFFLPTFFRSFAILLLAHFFPRAHWPKVWHRLETHILSGSNSGLFSFYVAAPNWSN